MDIFDIEYIVIYISLGLLFLCGLRLKEKQSAPPLFVIDLSMSKALKGIACVMILTSHWGLYRFQGIANLGHISKIVWSMAANIALVWFMFFSGYGMSLKKLKKGKLLHEWKRSCIKIYAPCLLVCLATFILYAFLPDSFTIKESQSISLDADIHLIHNMNKENFMEILPNMFGNQYWYVICILYFYTMFYISSWISMRYRMDITCVLSATFFIYFIIAYKYYGAEQAHFYRFCWTFMFGHACARRTRISWIMAAFFLLTVLADKSMMNVDLWAVFGLLIISIANQWFDIRGKGILYLGAISYIFYLAHIRIGYNILCYTGSNSIIIWLLISLISSAIIYELYIKLKSSLKI